MCRKQLNKDMLSSSPTFPIFIGLSKGLEVVKSCIQVGDFPICLTHTDQRISIQQLFQSICFVSRPKTKSLKSSFLHKFEQRSAITENSVKLPWKAAGCTYSQ